MIDAGVLTVKAGEYFCYVGQITATSVAGLSIRCKIAKQSGQIVHDFGTVPVQPDGSFLLAAMPSDTALWPVCTAETDLAVIDATGRVFATETKQVRIKKLISGA